MVTLQADADEFEIRLRQTAHDAHIAEPFPDFSDGVAWRVFFSSLPCRALP